MYPVSDAFLEKIKENTREYYWTGTITTKNGTKYDFTNQDILKGSAYVNQKCCGNGEMEIGSVYAAEMKVTLFNNIDRYTLTDAEVTLDYHLKLDDGKEETVPMGVFLVSEANRKIKTLEITAYDRMLLLDKDFKITDMVGTPYEILSLMATDCGVELEQSQEQIEGMTNGKETFAVYTDNDIETWRDILFYIAQAMCSFAAFNRKGKLELRQYTMDSVFEINSIHRFGSSFSDFKTRYTAISSTNQRTKTAEYYALETDNGLTMNLGSNPLLQYGLQGTRDRIHKKILEQLSVFEYIPFDSTTIGNPALDVGDVIQQKGGHADNDSFYCITEFECKVNGKQTLKGVGKNPRLAAAKSKNEKNISGLINSAEESKIIYYNFVNASDLTIGEKQAEIISIQYVAVEDTTAMFLAQIILNAIPSEEGKTVILKITYKKGLEEVTSFYPIETYFEGKHTMALFFPLEVTGKTDNNFSVYMNIESGGSAKISAGNIRATISGQELAAGTNEWDGKITITETVGNTIFWENGKYSVDNFISKVTLVPQNPVGSPVTETMERVEFGTWSFDVASLDENINAAPVIKSFTVDSIYPPAYNGEYVYIDDGAFTMISSYEVPESVESTVNYGRMSVLAIDTEQFESVGSMEVIKC